MHLKTYLGFLKELFTTKTKFATESFQSVYDIDFINDYPEVKLIIFDFDDTLSEHHGALEDEIESYLDNLKKLGKKIAIYSNSNNRRRAMINDMCNHLDIKCINIDEKPEKSGFLELMREHNVLPKETAMVGDRVGTDMYGSYLAGIKYRFLVSPYSHVFSGKRSSLLERSLIKLENNLYKFTRSKS
jgi:HAD superfamily phosphatase (TIGR01668 family)